MMHVLFLTHRNKMAGPHQQSQFLAKKNEVVKEKTKYNSITIQFSQVWE